MNEKRKRVQAQPQNSVKQKDQAQQKPTKQQQEDEAIQAFIGHVEKNDDNPEEC